MEYGGFWRRVFACICDSIVAMIPAYLLIAVLVKAGFDLMGLVVNLAAFLVYLGYFVLLQSSSLQTTVGKALLGLKVATASGERASFLRILGRELAKIISAIPLMIGYLLAAFTERKQALHDMIASTVVQKVGPAHPLKGAVVVALAAFGVYGIVNAFLGKAFEQAMQEAQAGTVPAKQGLPAPDRAAVAAAPSAPTKPVAPEPPKATSGVTVQAVTTVPAATQASAIKPPVVRVAATPAPAAAKSAAKPAAAPAPQPVAAAPPRPTPPSVAAPTVAAPAVATLRFNDLVTAVLYRDTWAVNDLLAFGKWPDKPDSQGMTPLMLAVMLGDVVSAEALLKAGANPNRPGPGGDTAVSIARERQDAAMQALLQRYGAR